MLHYIDVLTVAVQAASSDSDGGGLRNFAFLFLLAGFVFYGLTYMRYRNVTKRHHHESETAAETRNIQADDSYAGSVTGVRNSRMSGANNNSVRGSRTSWF